MRTLPSLKVIWGHGHVGLGARSSPKGSYSPEGSRCFCPLWCFRFFFSLFHIVPFSVNRLCCLQGLSLHMEKQGLHSPRSQSLFCYFPSLLSQSYPVLQLREAESFRPGVTKGSIHSGRRVSVCAAGLMRVTPCPQAPLSASVPPARPGLVIGMAQPRAWQLLLALSSSLKSLFCLAPLLCLSLGHHPLWHLTLPARLQWAGGAHCSSSTSGPLTGYWIRTFCQWLAKKRRQGIKPCLL